ncbi:mannose-1-phosphate guanylyltransferase/mannose-6-phosphate isomerase [Hyphomicrobium sp.]|uniref:mannose-1-phosphate guanylyltransferase/mannose-6-phosphate isomerase n=1 Tax=Hyphomicrobium sp. TaxID=82 RepID=UPI002E2F6E01|nr:mannose-1-phosphate guanylyltransferase/mannose-6-phosphate isomerase [Hyphomicrobium sp.]HEX2842514.1 mannose-1-phosphate guanylyltransferase/mannose-6-phosphate isomerase [Hyphomicrobium sp.]
MRKITPVILSGGSGTRLWPLSRSMYPKQCIRGLNGERGSLLSATLARLSPDAGFGAPLVVCNNAHRFLVKDDCEQAAVAPRALILEPVARNTAPAIAVAALFAAKEDPSSILVVMPSDHDIKDVGLFRAAVERAAEVADKGKIVLFGVTPSEPNTGFGYIHRGPALDGADAFAIRSFTEKPDAETARTYLASGDYYWNSGIFVFRPEVFLAELAVFAPDVLEAARGALAKAEKDLGFLRLDQAEFEKAPSISVDYAVMENTEAAAMLAFDLGWSDLGSWSSLWDAAARDDEGNYIQGDSLLEDTRNCYIHSERSLISTIGVKDLVIVQTPDTVLVADKSRSQDVSKIVTRLKLANRREHEQHVRSYRPWGYFETLNIGSRFQVKLLHVKPGGVLSLQMHHHRSEHWVVVQGTAKVTIEGVEKLVRENESVYIVATQWHRLENPGKVPLELIEVQIGSYLGEDDIIRSDDIYARGAEEVQ